MRKFQNFKLSLICFIHCVYNYFEIARLNYASIYQGLFGVFYTYNPTGQIQTSLPKAM